MKDALPKRFIGYVSAETEVKAPARRSHISPLGVIAAAVRVHVSPVVVEMGGQKVWAK
jgi:hypothetical protein